MTYHLTIKFDFFLLNVRVNTLIIELTWTYTIKIINLSTLISEMDYRQIDQYYDRLQRVLQSLKPRWGQANRDLYLGHILLQFWAETCNLEYLCFQNWTFWAHALA